MMTVTESTRVRPKLAVFHNLPPGGGVNVAGGLLRELQPFFSITVHCPSGSCSLDVPGTIPIKKWPYPAGRRLSGLRKLLAPLSLPARLRAFDALCYRIARKINSTAEVVLVHNSMFVAAPPVLKYLTVPSVYFCYEFPRHLYEPELISRTGNGLSRFLLSPLRGMEKRIDGESAANADGIVTLSSWMKGRIADIYRLDASIVRPGVDTDYFCIEKNAVRKNVVLSVGALWPFKGHRMAIDVISRIPPHSRPSLTVVADREYPGYGSDLERSAVLTGVDLDVRKEISNDELLQLYSSCRAVLCCGHNEPYGLVPLEAMACGLPVIAVGEGGFVDNIENGENGILVNRDPHEMASVLEKVLLNDDLRRKLTLKGREFVTGKRTMKEAGRRLTEILTDTVNRIDKIL